MRCIVVLDLKYKNKHLILQGSLICWSKLEEPVVINTKQYVWTACMYTETWRTHVTVYPGSFVFAPHVDSWREPIDLKSSLNQWFELEAFQCLSVFRGRYLTSHHNTRLKSQTVKLLYPDWTGLGPDGALSDRAIWSVLRPLQSDPMNMTARALCMFMEEGKKCFTSVAQLEKK